MPKLPNDSQSENPVSFLLIIQIRVMMFPLKRKALGVGCVCVQ